MFLPVPNPMHTAALSPSPAKMLTHISGSLGNEARGLGLSHDPVWLLYPFLMAYISDILGAAAGGGLPSTLQSSLQKQTGWAGSQSGATLSGTGLGYSGVEVTGSHTMTLTTDHLQQHTEQTASVLSTFLYLLFLKRFILEDI